MAAAKKQPAKAKAKVGRPTDYSEELANIICERVATSTLGLNRLCEKYDDMPVKSTVNLWRYKYPEFSTQYAQAKLFQADLLAEECLDIADDDSQDTRIDPETGFETCNTEFIARARVRIDTRKWLAAKLLPKQYGPVVEDKKSISESIVEKLIDRLVE
jgi:hypothetical protein